MTCGFPNTTQLDAITNINHHQLTLKMSDSEDLLNDPIKRAKYLERHLYNPPTGRLTGAQLMPPPTDEQLAAKMSLPLRPSIDEWPCEMFIAQITAFVDGTPPNCPAPYIEPEYLTDKLEVAIENAATCIRQHSSSPPPIGKYIDRRHTAVI